MQGRSGTALALHHSVLCFTLESRENGSRLWNKEFTKENKKQRGSTKAKGEGEAGREQGGEAEELSVQVINVIHQQTVKRNWSWMVAAVWMVLCSDAGLSAEKIL